MQFVSVSIPEYCTGGVLFKEGIGLYAVDFDGWEIYGTKPSYKTAPEIIEAGDMLELLGENNGYTFPSGTVTIKVPCFTEKSVLCKYIKEREMWKIVDDFIIMEGNEEYNYYLKGKINEFGLIGALEYNSIFAAQNIESLFYVDRILKKIKYKGNLDKFFDIKIINMDTESDLNLIDENGNINFPFEDKEVKIIFEIKDKETGETAKSKEIVLLIEKIVNEKTKIPLFSPPAGVYLEPVSVKITSETERAEIYYTIDGTTPSKESIKYDSEIFVNKNMQLKAIAYSPYNIESDIAEGEYTIKETKVSKPIFYPEEGEYLKEVNIKIETTTSNTAIYYTVDGSEPDVNSTLYNGDIYINETTVIKAVAYKNGLEPSDIVKKTYIIRKNLIENEMLYVKGGIYKFYYVENNIKFNLDMFVIDFYISKYEIFERDYNKLMGIEMELIRIGKNYPKVNISWLDTIKYCNKLSEKDGLAPAYDEITGEFKDKNGNITKDVTKVEGYRLPNEIEWQYAANDGEGYNMYYYSGSNDLGSVAWTNQNTRIIQEAGQKTPNALGIYDMTGNAGELCNDWYKENIIKSFNMCVSPYNDLNTNDLKVVKGGSINSLNENYYNSSYEYINYKNYNSYNGFRLVRSVLNTENIIPEGSFSITTSGLDMYLKGTLKDNDGEVVLLSIDWGDGNTDKKEAPISISEYYHKYALEGNYEILIKAIDDKGGIFEEKYNIEILLDKTADPVFITNPGEYIRSIYVELETETTGASIYYTLDGTEPDTNSLKYENAIYLTEAKTIKAIAYKENLKSSNIVSAYYNVRQNLMENELKFVKGGFYNYIHTYNEPDSGVEISREIDMYINDFYAAEYEILEKDYKLLMGIQIEDYNFDKKYPITKISWLDAIKYCNKLNEMDGLPSSYDETTGELLDGNGVPTTDITRVIGYRLLNEMEWQYAADSTGKLNYSGSDSLEDIAWTGAITDFSIQEIGMKLPNEFGLYDMTGNAKELCNDWYDEFSPDYYDMQINPYFYSKNYQFKIAKGGGIDSEEKYYYNKSREYIDYSIEGEFTGFRVGKSAPASLTNLIPEIYADYKAPDENNLINLEIKTTDSDGKVVLISIAWGDGNISKVRENLEKFIINYNYTASGKYEIEITAMDNNGGKNIIKINAGIPDSLYKTADPIFSLPPNEVENTMSSYMMSQTLELTSSTSGASIYYTLDGTEPDETSIKYEKPILVSETGFIKARAYKEGLEPSEIVERYYRINRLNNQKEVTLKYISTDSEYNIAIGIFEVTIGEYMEFLEETLNMANGIDIAKTYIYWDEFVSGGYIKLNSDNIYEMDEYKKDYPMPCVKPLGVLQYCNWKNIKNGINFSIVCKISKRLCQIP